MTTRRQCVRRISSSKLCSKSADGYDYTLYELRVWGKQKYLICVEDAEGSDAEMIGGTYFQAREFFGMLCHHEASSTHLCDLAEDYRRIIYATFE